MSRMEAFNMGMMPHQDMIKMGNMEATRQMLGGEAQSILNQYKGKAMPASAGSDVDALQTAAGHYMDKIETHKQKMQATPAEKLTARRDSKVWDNIYGSGN